MSYKKLIVPIGTALAALIANASEASIVPADSQSEPQEKTSRASIKSTDPILQRLTYQIKEQAHTLTLHKSAADVLYAQHGSHSSHGSHQSHSSHRSGY
jgi:hypothetical protein